MFALCSLSNQMLMLLQETCLKPVILTNTFSRHFNFKTQVKAFYALLFGISHESVGLRLEFLSF